MNNFIFENKTKVYFGKGGVKEYLGSLLGNYGETVMLAYGGGSIKRNGVYDEIMGILNAKGKRVVEFSCIMSNPTYACVGDKDGIANWWVMQARLEAMQQAGIDTEFHVYSGLGHGFGLGTGTSAEGWINDAVSFWEKQMKK